MKYRGYIFEIEVNKKAFQDAYSKYSKNVEAEEEQIVSDSFYGLHPEIYTKCISLYESGAYAEAVEKSFKTVKDRLRNLTGYERAFEAFGKGNLHIKGAAAENVDKDFNEGVKFLTMAIDMFRNEKSHTSDAKIEDPVRAHQYLSMSSLALYLLEQGEIKNKK